MAGDTYTLVSNLGLTTTALTTLILFQLKYAFYWCRYRDRTMLLAVYIQREVHDAKDHGYGTISLRGRSRGRSRGAGSWRGRYTNDSTTNRRRRFPCDCFDPPSLHHASSPPARRPGIR